MTIKINPGEILDYMELGTVEYNTSAFLVLVHDVVTGELKRIISVDREVIEEEKEKEDE